MLRTSGFLAILAALLFGSPALAEDSVITLGTGAVTGVYYPAGGAICRLVNRTRKEHGIRCFVESTGGSIANINAIRDGELNFGIVQSDWQYRALVGDHVFENPAPYNELRSVFSLHSEMFTVVAGKHSNIRKFADLRGKRINLTDSGLRQTLGSLVAGQKNSAEYFAHISELKPTDAVKALCDGRVDAMVMALGHPNGMVQEITSVCGGRLIAIDGPEVDRLIAQTPYYARTAIPGGLYAGNSQNVPTFGVKATLVTSSDTPDEVVYQLTKAVFDNFDSFKTLHFVFSTLDRDRMVFAGLSAPLHPGALRYFREAGLIRDTIPPPALAPATIKPATPIHGE